MLVGYARVSQALGQDPALQVQAIHAAGAERVIVEHAPGGRWARPEFQRLLDTLRPGDALVVWKLDRLSRSLQDLLTLLDCLKMMEVDFRSLTESIDTTTPAGRMMLQMIGAFAEFEREMIRERTREGLAAARLEGRVGGRRPKLSATQRAELVHGVQAGRYSMAQAAQLFEVHPATVTRLMQAQTQTKA